MASKVEICNFALQNLGQELITSLDEKTKNARECNLRFDSARRSLLRMHLWNFAIKRASLNRETSTPAFNYSYQFSLPSDCLKVIMTETEETFQALTPIAIDPINTISEIPNRVTVDKYRIEGKKLISDEQVVGIKYIADITDTGQFDSNFTELLARLLAANIARSITDSRTEAEYHLKVFQQEFEEYISIDSQEGVFDTINYSTFLSSRF